MSKVGNLDSVFEGILSCDDINSFWYIKLNMSVFFLLVMSRRLDSVGKYFDLSSMGVFTKSLVWFWSGGSAISTFVMLFVLRTFDR